jgi:hypothetical protein
VKTALPCSRREPIMQDEKKINRWIALAGFTTLAVVLLIEGMALYHLFDGPMPSRPPAMVWPETIMRLLFGQTR